MNYLDCLRDRIDKIDSELIRLFEERMDIVSEVAKFKEENNIPILDRIREEEVIKKNLLKIKNKDIESETRDFLEHLMGISRRYQGKKIFSKESNLKSINIKNICIHDNCTIGFQGVRGSFSEQALLEYFGDNVKTLNVPEFEDIFIELKNGKIDYGVLPIENSSTGGITEVYDLLRCYGFYIVGEKCINIKHNLLGIKGCKIEDIKEVYSHSQAFEQSRKFFKGHPDWTLIPYHNTALGAQYVKSMNDKTKAAVAGKITAEVYNLDILEENINCCENNKTRFIIIGRNLEINKDCNKVSVVFALEHKVGSLYNALKYFAENNLNMLKIESRPIIDKSWQYFFYIDFEGNINNTKVENALRLINKNSSYFKLLGNYKSSI